MKEFATSGVNQDELKELLELVASKATFLSSLLAYLLNNTITAIDKVKCPDQYITALASTSPVCALIRPDPQLHRVIKQIANGLNSFETSMLHFLQQNCTILVNLIQKVHIPHKAMFSLFMELLERSNAPFVEVSSQLTFDSNRVFQDNGCFPALQTGQHRRCYSTDTIKSSKICSKRGTPHPFCGHGL